jgi:hypothetical protein
LQAHCQSRTKPTLQPKLCQRACKANAGQNWFKKIPDPSKKNKKRHAQPTLNDTEIQQRQWFTSTDNRTPAANITYTQAGVSCFVGQESSKFKVKFFVGSSVVKIPACV